MSRDNIRKWVAILILLLVSVVVGNLIGEDDKQKIGLTILILIGGLWISELIPLTITALLVPLLAYFTHIFEAKEALSHFANPIIYLFLGGFALASVLSEHGIDRWLATKMIHLSGGNKWVGIIFFLASSSFLSMWISNTATTAMLLPIGMSLVDKKYPRTRVFVILGTAYAANIGGLATLVGSPPNLIAAAALNIDFVTWIKFGLPFTILFFPVFLLVMKLVIRPEKSFQLNNFEVKNPWTIQKTKATVYFFSIVILWILSKPISGLLNVESFDSMVGIAATAMVPILGLNTWVKLEKNVNWGILILFGGGLCLSAVLGVTGTSEMLANKIISNIQSDQGLLLILVATTFMIFLTELSSNTGSAAIMVPIMMEVARQFNPIYMLPIIMAIGISANCAFMLPVATPPNALAYATNEVTIKQMMRVGMILNLLAIPLIWLIVSWDLFNIF
jgi:sodium-dependent dicarboxylate transporter 2/3/5